MQRFLSNTQDIMRYERFLLIMKYTRPNKISLRVRRKFYRVNEEGNQLYGRPIELVNKKFYRETVRCEAREMATSPFIVLFNRYTYACIGISTIQIKNNGVRCGANMPMDMNNVRIVLL